MYSSSVTTGDWETYVARDLVAYIDSHYRTIASRRSRGLAGHSMGGYGALRIGMKRPDVFSSLYLMSSCCLNASLTFDPGRMAPSEAIKTREAAEEAGRGRGFGPSVNLAEGAAWSPNPNNPPLYLDLPVKDGKLQPDVVAKWAANAPLAMLDQYITNLKMYDAIAIEIGAKDSLFAANKQLDEAMTAFGVAHGYEEYDGDHTNRVFERVEQNLLPFFSKHLSFDGRASSTKH
jgi:S-formylglutathione hydrolase FrmB